MTTTTKRAREYLRVSQDKSGSLESPAEQHGENAEHAERSGWELGEAYAEAEAVGASRHSVKERDTFPRLVADIEHGRFGAHILILWESSRGSRQVGEWVRMIDACELSRVRVYVTTHGRLYDPANPRDRRSLLEDAVDSEYESAKTRTRVLRSTAARAAKGQPHGRVPFGYRRVYDAVTRRLAGQEKHPDEAPVVEELFRRLRAGDPARAIERDFAERGIATRGSARWPPRPFTRQALVQMALSPAYAGLRTRQPKGTARRPGLLDGAVEAAWPPIVDDETFYAVRELLTSPSRRKSRDGRARNLLGMIAACGVCSGPLTARYYGGKRFYVCQGAAHVRCPADDLDAVAKILVIGWLSRADVAEAARPSAGALPEMGRVYAELSKAVADLGDWRRRAGRREVSPESFAVIEPPILADIERLKGRVRELSAPPEFAGWLGPADKVTRKWDASPVEVRRIPVRGVLCRQRAGVLKVTRASARGIAVPVAERVRLDREA